MKVCPKCGNLDIEEDAELCPYCLYKFEIKKPQSKEITNAVPEKVSQAKEAIKRSDLMGQEDEEVLEEILQELKQTIPKQDVKRRNVDGKRKNGFIYVIIIFAACLMVRSCAAKLSEKPSEGNHEKQASSSSANPVQEKSQASKSESAENGGKPEKAGVNEEQSEDMDREYVLPNSDSQYLTYTDLVGLSAEELRIARNELYARHGRKFRDTNLQEYFESRSWYQGTIEPDDFTDKIFNEYELANKALITSYEHELGVNGQ